MKRIAAVILAALLLCATVRVHAFTDEYIESDAVDRLYTGREEAYALRFNLSFTDMGEYFWAAEATARNGALNLIKGFEDRFYPERDVVQVDAISHIMRALGYEKTALTQASGIGAQLPAGVPTETLLDLAYLNLAASASVISTQDYDDAMYEVRTRQTLLNEMGQEAADAFEMPDFMFRMNDPATRETVAYWIYMALQTVSKSLWESPQSVQYIYQYRDWTDITPAFLTAAEAMLINSIMSGDAGVFLPKQTMNRAELSVTLARMHDIYYNAMGIERKTGIVAGVVDSEGLTTAEYNITRQILVRTSDGLKDVLEFKAMVSPTAPGIYSDAIVYKDGKVQGLQSLVECDVIEYLVETASGTVLYVQSLGVAEPMEIQGILDAVDVLGRTITLREIDNNKHTYTFIDGMGGVTDDGYYFIMDKTRINTNQLPVGSVVAVTLFANTVVSARYIGEPVDVTVGSGIVLENDPLFGFITILEHGGGIVTKRYYENDMVVEKKAYYETTDGIGYISQVFPHFGFNSRLTTIADLTAGDLVTFRCYEDDPDVIRQIYAETNYTVRFGRLLGISPGTGYTELLIEYENKRTAWFSVADGIFVTKDGRPADLLSLAVGDWVRLLVNAAIIEPGRVEETVVEINIEGPERHIETFVKGNLSGIDEIQNKLILHNVQTLAKTGWTNFRNIENFDLSGRDIEYYVNGERVGKDYAIKFFKHGDATVYLGLESSHLGDRVKVVSFRESRDMPLDPDTVMAATGGGSFEMLTINGVVTADDGTIVVRHGRLVSQRDIYPGDYAQVVLNGNGVAAIVDITDYPDNSRLLFASGMVLNVDDGVSFTVRGMSTLSNWDWNYTPVERVFDIDYNTVFLDQDGYVSPDSFITYTEDTVYESYFTIVADGSRAAFVVRAPFCDGTIMGTVYNTDETAIYLKDVQYLDNNTGLWHSVSAADNTLVITIHPNTLIAKNNSVVTVSALEIGDSLLVKTPDLAGYGQLLPGSQVDGYIIKVER